MLHPLSACFSLTQAHQARSQQLARAAERQHQCDADRPATPSHTAHLVLAAGNTLIALGLWLRARGTVGVQSLQPSAATPTWLTSAPALQPQPNRPSVTLLYWGFVTYGLGGSVQRAYLAPLLPVPAHVVPALLSGTSEQTLRP